MSKIRLIFLLLVTSICCYAQKESTSVRPILRNEAFALRYGEDKDSWPLWARDSVDLSNGMDLNSLSMNALTCDGAKIEFDETLDFESMESAYAVKKVIQNGFSFAYVNDQWLFDSSIMKIDRTAPIQCRIESKGIALNELSTIREKFPKSYDWRDGIPNMLLSVISEEYWNDIVLVIFSIAKSDDTLQLFYYKEKLFFMYKGISTSDK
ncbi:hypothetical protein OB69_04485 [Roseivirga seohaensis subsp. aquiponti]|uniref:Uncharacterized protein n=1 Tax=Roseivirga seohaensis subsp. aquiponti TaxID=1566026 RepID=A0A0L8ANC0_9BACT|nr:hypothetical protein [Roseivirga seohaensis]KOF03819.1 hypothetical protein OB69_04485 [Roseivirga seohaensis subsp. aquiponti]